MTSDTATVLLALGAFLPGVAALWAQWRAAKADTTSAASLLTSAASGLVHDLREEITRLREVVYDLQHLVSALESEIVTLGGDPNRIRLEVISRRRSTDRIEGTPI